MSKTLRILSFELDAKIIGQFRQWNPATDAPTDLDAWPAFEAEAFLNKRVLDVPKTGARRGRRARGPRS